MAAEGPTIGQGNGAVVRRWGLPAILLLGLMVRLALLVTPRAYQADEIFQYLEQAHRLVFGNAVIPWEYRSGVRSWLFPIALAGPMAFGGWIAPGSSAYLLAPKLALVLLSLGSVAAAAALGRRISFRHALMAAAVASGWSEFALFGTQALTDSAAVPIFLAAAALLYGPPTKSRLIAAGALAALAILIRFQYGPAILLFVAMICRLDMQRWGWGLLGAALVLAGSALVDHAMGQAPFAWVFENYRQNIVEGRSHLWVDGPLYYPRKILSTWTIWLIPIAILAWIGAKHYPALLVMALVNIAVHSTIAHKEYRYILLSTMVIVVLAGIGTMDLVKQAKRRWPRVPWLQITLVGWAAASILTTRPHFVAYDWSLATPSLEAFSTVREDPDICGVAVRDIWWSHTGGYAYLHRPIPLYLPGMTSHPDSALKVGQAAYDVIVAPPKSAGALPAAFRQDRCFGTDARYPDQAVCIFRRPGSCDGRQAHAFEINHALAATNR